MEESISGRPAVAAGDVNLALYDDRFDNRLFELWCLRLLGSEIANALNLPEPTVSTRWRSGEPAYTFENFEGRLDLYFQRSIPAVARDGRATTRSRADDRSLGGIPDIVVRAQPLGGTERLAVLDPKLRQRDRLPAEELYKVLGYLQNFNVDPAVGGVLIYTAEADPRPPDVFEDGHGGTLLACTLNPSATADVNAAAHAPAVAMVLKLIDAGTTDRTADGSSEPDEGSALEDVVEGTRRALMS